MSREFQIAFPCPHIIGEERVALGSDRRTLLTSKPIGGYGLLSVVANDSLVIPPGIGVVAHAKVKSGRKEPYHIVRNQNEVVVQTATQSARVTLPVGYLTAQTVADAVNAAIRAQVRGQLAMEASVDGNCLVLSELVEIGPFSRVSLTGSAQGPLGFGHQNGSTGKAVIPSWSLYDRAAVETGSTGYFIRFDSAIRSNCYFRVTYSVAPQQCLRCLGTEVENDFRYDAQNQPLMVRGFNLLYQSCLKIILTQVNSNIYYKWYGTSLVGAIGTKALAGAAPMIQQTVRKALTYLQSLQTKQGQFQPLTAEERLYSVDRVDVIPSPVDPTTFLVDVQVRSFSNNPVNITIVYTAPGTFALPGTNDLSLGNFG